MIQHRFVILLALVGGAGVSACATKSDIQLLQSELALTRAQSARRDSAHAAQLAQVVAMQRALFDSIQATGVVMARIRGNLGNDLYEIKQQLVQIQELTGQSQQRLSELRIQLEQQREAQVRTAIPGDTAATGQPRSAGVNASAEEMYTSSIAQLNGNRLSTARAGLQQLIQSYPTSERVPDALYFIGQSFAVSAPDSAAFYYKQVIDRHPKSRHAAAALYNSGLLAERRGDKAQARTIYQRVVKEYANSNEADLAGEKLKALRR